MENTQHTLYLFKFSEVSEEICNGYKFRQFILSSQEGNKSAGGRNRCAGQRPVSEHCAAESDLFFRECKNVPLKLFRRQNIKESLGLSLAELVILQSVNWSFGNSSNKQLIIPHVAHSIKLIM